MTPDGMPIAMLRDADLADLDPRTAVEAMREAAIAAEDGRLVAPARISAPLDDGRLVVTAGEWRGVCFGFRSYDTRGHEDGEQVVVAHDARTGVVEAIAVGTLLGQIRTGALGGLAADLLADPAADTLAIVGAGHQAWQQIRMVAAVRPLSLVRLASRTRPRADALAERVREELGLPCEVATTPERCVAGAGLVVLATSSRTPVLEARDLDPDAHITTLGPKRVDGAEFDEDLLATAALLATDSRAQLLGYDPPTLAASTGRGDDVVTLGALATAAVARPPRGRSVFLSVGLAGTEVLLLHRIARRSA